MGAGNAVNSHLAVVENWRDIAEAGRNVKWRRRRSHNTMGSRRSARRNG